MQRVQATGNELNQQETSYSNRKHVKAKLFQSEPLERWSTTTATIAAAATTTTTATPPPPPPTTTTTTTTTTRTTTTTTTTVRLWLSLPHASIELVYLFPIIPPECKRKPLDIPKWKFVLQSGKTCRIITRIKKIARSQRGRTKLLDFLMGTRKN